MRTLALAILTMGIVFAAGHARLRRMTRLFPLRVGKRLLPSIAATIRWTNAGRRLTVSSAFPTHITLVRRRRGDETIGVISSGWGSIPNTSRTGVFLARRSQPLNYSRSMGLVRVSPVRRVRAFFYAILFA